MNYSVIRTVVLSGVFLLLGNLVVGEPVKTFPELLEKIKEHREMIKDASGSMSIRFHENSPAKVLLHFKFLNNEWQIRNESVRQKIAFITDLENRQVEWITENDCTQYTTNSLELTYNPDTNNASITKMDDMYKGGPFTHWITTNEDHIPLYGVDTFDWGVCKLSTLYENVKNHPEDSYVVPYFKMDNNLLSLTIDYQDKNSNMHLYSKIWFDPEKQYSIVRYHEGNALSWQLQKTEIEMAPVGNPPVYFPKRVKEHLHHKSNSQKDYYNETTFLYENIKINTGLTQDDVNIKLPKDTKVSNSIDDIYLITTADNVTLDQVLAGENVAEISEDEYFGREKEEEPSSGRKAPPPPPQKVNPLLSWRFWIYVIEFLGLGLLVLLLVRYRSSKKESSITQQ